MAVLEIDPGATTGTTITDEIVPVLQKINDMPQVLVLAGIFLTIYFLRNPVEL